MVSDAEWLALDAGESVVWWGQPRLRRILPAVGKAAFWTAAFLAVAVLGPAVAPPAVPPLAVAAGGLVLAALSASTAVRAYLRTRNVYYVLTDRNVYVKRGVLSTTVTRVGVANVQNTRLRKHLLGNLFDYGTVAISSAGSRGADLVVSDLDDPEQFRAELQRLTGAARPDAVDPPTAPALDADGADALLAETAALRGAAERLAEAIAP